MKYIRTKDGRIVAIPNNSKLVLYDDEKLVIDTTKKGQTCVYGLVDRQANTIEELCDRFFVFFNGKRKNDQSVLRNYQSAKAYFSRNKKYKLNHIKEIYGAIWTDKGLIYVAKMNDKGELELL